jgi:LemA protein
MFGYNGLNSQRLAVQQARSNLQSTLQRRADTLPQLANLTREGTAREREFVDLVNKAQQGLRSGDLNQQLEGNEALKQAMTMAGSNPRFRSSALYQDLMSEVAGAENRINVARQRYNDAATRYNGTAQSFPNNLVRPLFGFPGEMPLFQPKGNVDVPPSL